MSFGEDDVLVFENLRCSKEGLTTEAAEERLGIFGHNKLEEKKMSSTAGKCPVPGQTVGSASKFSLNGYLYTLRSELIQKGINVTAVCPGPIAMKPLFKGTNSAEKPVLTDRCVHLIITAATHKLKEVWIANQVILFKQKTSNIGGLQCSK